MVWLQAVCQLFYCFDTMTFNRKIESSLPPKCYILGVFDFLKGACTGYFFRLRGWMAEITEVFMDQSEKLWGNYKIFFFVIIRKEQSETK